MQFHAGTTVRNIGFAYGMNHAQIVGYFWKVLPQFAHWNARFSAGPELPRAPHQVAPICKRDSRAIERQLLAVVLVQLRFWVKQIDMGWATMHEQKNDPFGSGGNPGQRTGIAVSCDKPGWFQHAGECKTTEPDAQLIQ